MQTISVIAPFTGCGVTHTAINIASTLAQKGNKVCLVDKNKANPDIGNIAREEGFISDETDGDFFQYKKIDFVLYKDNFSLVSLRKENYDFVILDCGTEITDMCLQADQLVIVSGSRIWNRGREVFYAFCENIDELIGIENALFVFPFADENARKELKEFVGSAKAFFPDVCDAFTPCFDLELLGLKDVDADRRSLFINLSNSLPSLPSKISKISGISRAGVGRHGIDETERRQIMDEAKAEAEKTLEEEKEKYRLETDRQQEEIEKEHFKATHDTLTHCLNRLGYEEALRNYTEDNICIVNFDVNNLKVTNDTFGHQSGDLLLTTVADTLRNSFENVFRVGGDEFTVIGTAELLDSVDDTLSYLDEVLNEKSEGSEIIFEVSHGYASSRDFDETVSFEMIYHEADKRMYEDKKAKKDARLSEEELIIRKQAQEQLRLKEETERLETERLKKELEEKQKEAERQKAIEKAKEKMERENNLIPNTIAQTEEVSETKEYKMLSTMWYASSRVSYELNGRYEEMNLYVYPLAFVESPFSLPIAVVYETRGEYQVCASQDAYAIVPLNAQYSINVSARFLNDGLNVDIISQSDAVTILDIKKDIHNGLFTPLNFGKIIKLNSREGNEVIVEAFPIRTNINGLCDTLIKIDNEFSVNDGHESFITGDYYFYLQDDRFVIDSE